MQVAHLVKQELEVALVDPQKVPDGHLHRLHPRPVMRFVVETRNPDAPDYDPLAPLVERGGPSRSCAACGREVLGASVIRNRREVVYCAAGCQGEAMRLGSGGKIKPRPQDAERFIEEVRGDDLELASYLRIRSARLPLPALGTKVGCLPRRHSRAGVH